MRLLFQHVFDAPIEGLFSFHENPQNLALLLRNLPEFRLVSHAGRIHEGDITRVRQRVGICWIAMDFEHFLYEPPARFGERLVKGPFRRFVHIHRFESAGAATQLTDELDVRLPLSLGGEAAMRLFVAPRLRRFFAHRHAALEHLIDEGVVPRSGR